MTSNSNLKKTIRARQEQTGETYTEARRHVTAGRRPSWLKVSPTDGSRFAGARRLAADGVPVVFLDEGGPYEDETLEAAMGFDPVVLDLNDLSLRLDPFSMLSTPERKARAAASLLNTVMREDVPRTLETDLLEAATRGDASLLQALDGRHLLLNRTRELIVASSWFGRLAQAGEAIDARAGVPLLVRGSLWDDLHWHEPVGDQKVSARIVTAALSLIQELGAEALGSESTQMVVYWRTSWFIFDRSQQALRPAPSDFDLPDDAPLPTKGDGFATSAWGELTWSPAAGRHVVVAGAPGSGKSVTVDTLVRRAADAGAKVFMYRADSMAADRARTAPTLAAFAADLVELATERLVQGRFDEPAVVVVDGLTELLQRREVPPSPSIGLPQHLISALFEVIREAESHNMQVENVETLLDQFVRRSAELRTTVIFASTTLNKWERFGGLGAWANVTMVHLGVTGHRHESGLPGWLAAEHRSDSPGRASIAGPAFSGVRVAQVYSAAH